MPLSNETEAQLDSMLGVGRPDFQADVTPETAPAATSSLEQTYRELDDMFSRDTDVGAALDIASRRDPDRHARNLQLAESAELPVDTVERNQDEVARRERLKLIDFSGFPKTKAFMTDPDNASVAFDDLDILKNLEEVVPERPWWQEITRTFEGLTDVIPERMRQSFRGAMMAGVERGGAGRLPATVEAFGGGIPEELIREITGKRLLELDEAKQVAIDKLMADYEAGEKRIQDFTPKDLALWQEGLRGGMESVIVNAPGILTSLLTRQPAFALGPMGAYTGFEAYGAARTEGLSPTQAFLHSSAQAAIEIGTELLPMKTLVEIAGKWGKGKTREQIVKFLAQELGGETVATLGQSMVDVISGMDEEIARAWERGDISGILEIQARRQAVTLIAAAFGGGIQAGVASGIGAAGRALFKRGGMDAERMLESLDEQGRIDQIISGAQQSQTQGRAPGNFEGFMQSLGPDVYIYLPQDAVRQLPEIPDYLEAQLDETGTDVSIPLATFTKELALDQEALAILRPHMRMRADTLTQEELQEGEVDGIDELMRQAEMHQEVKEEAERIYEDVVAQLKATGRMSDEFARTSAQLIPAYITTWVAKARRQGDELSVAEAYEQMFKRQGLRIVGPEVTPEEAGAVEPIIDQAAPIYQLEQDFGDLEFIEQVIERETGKRKTVRQKEQRLWQKAQDRRTNLQQLLECIRGA